MTNFSNFDSNFNLRSRSSIDDNSNLFQEDEKLQTEEDTEKNDFENKSRAESEQKDVLINELSKKLMLFEPDEKQASGSLSERRTTIISKPEISPTLGKIDDVSEKVFISKEDLIEDKDISKFVELANNLDKGLKITEEDKNYIVDIVLRFKNNNINADEFYHFFDSIIVNKLKQLEPTPPTLSSELLFLKAGKIEKQIFSVIKGCSSKSSSNTLIIANEKNYINGIAEIIQQIFKKRLETIEQRELEKFQNENLTSCIVIGRDIGLKGKNGEEIENLAKTFANTHARQIFRIINSCREKGHDSREITEDLLRAVERGLNEADYSNNTEPNSTQAAIIVEELIKATITINPSSKDFLKSIYLHNIGNKANAYNEWKKNVESYFSDKGFFGKKIKDPKEILNLLKQEKVLLKIFLENLEDIDKSLKYKIENNLTENDKVIVFTNLETRKLFDVAVRSFFDNMALNSKTVSQSTLMEIINERCIELKGELESPEKSLIASKLLKLRVTEFINISDKRENRPYVYIKQADSCESYLREFLGVPSNKSLENFLLGPETLNIKLTSFKGKEEFHYLEMLRTAIEMYEGYYQAALENLTRTHLQETEDVIKGRMFVNKSILSDKIIFIQKKIETAREQLWVVEAQLISLAQTVIQGYDDNFSKGIDKICSNRLNLTNELNYLNNKKKEYDYLINEAQNKDDQLMKSLIVEKSKIQKEIDAKHDQLKLKRLNIHQLLINRLNRIKREFKIKNHLLLQISQGKSILEAQKSSKDEIKQINIELSKKHNELVEKREQLKIQKEPVFQVSQSELNLIKQRINQLNDEIERSEEDLSHYSSVLNILKENPQELLGKVGEIEEEKNNLKKEIKLLNLKEMEFSVTQKEKINEMLKHLLKEDISIYVSDNKKSANEELKKHQLRLLDLENELLKLKEIPKSDDTLKRIQSLESEKKSVQEKIFNLKNIIGLFDLLNKNDPEEISKFLTYVVNKDFGIFEQLMNCSLDSKESLQLMRDGIKLFIRSQYAKISSDQTKIDELKNQITKLVNYLNPEKEGDSLNSLAVKAIILGIRDGIQEHAESSGTDLRTFLRDIFMFKVKNPGLKPLIIKLIAEEEQQLASIDESLFNVIAIKLDYLEVISQGLEARVPLPLSPSRKIEDFSEMNKIKNFFLENNELGFAKMAKFISKAKNPILAFDKLINFALESSEPEANLKIVSKSLAIIIRPAIPNPHDKMDKAKADLVINLINHVSPINNKTPKDPLPLKELLFEGKDLKTLRRKIFANLAVFDALSIAANEYTDSFRFAGSHLGKRATAAEETWKEWMHDLFEVLDFPLDVKDIFDKLISYLNKNKVNCESEERQEKDKLIQFSCTKSWQEVVQAIDKGQFAGSYELKHLSLYTNDWQIGYALQIVQAFRKFNNYKAPFQPHMNIDVRHPNLGELRENEKTLIFPFFAANVIKNHNTEEFEKLLSYSYDQISQNLNDVNCNRQISLFFNKGGNFNLIVNENLPCRNFMQLCQSITGFISKLEDELGVLKKSNEDLKQNIVKEENEIMKLQNKIDNLKIGGLETDKTILYDEIKKLENSIKEKKERKSDYDVQIKNSQEILVRDRKISDSLRNHIKAENDKKIIVINSRIDNINSQLSELDKNLKLSDLQNYSIRKKELQKEVLRLRNQKIYFSYLEKIIDPSLWSNSTKPDFKDYIFNIDAHINLVEAGVDILSKIKGGKESNNFEVELIQIFDQAVEQNDLIAIDKIIEESRKFELLDFVKEIIQKLKTEEGEKIQIHLQQQEQEEVKVNAEKLSSPSLPKTPAAKTK